MMKPSLLLILMMSALSLDARVTEQITEDSSHWVVKPTAGLFFAQNSYSAYYKGGGANSVALSTQFDLQAKFEKEENTWQNRLVAKYGIIKIDDHPFQKNQDHFEIDSKFDHKINKHLHISGVFNLKTNLHDAYEIKKSGQRGKRTGNFFAPAYLNLGSGLDYANKSKTLSVFYTPLNSKVTIVSDPSLIDQYLPPDRQDHAARYELGSLLRLELRHEIMTNIFLHSISNLFTNHLDNFGAFDVNIENQLNFKVNKYFTVNLMTNLIYDEDILFDIPVDEDESASTKQGPRTQFKEVLNIGLSHTF